MLASSFFGEAHKVTLVLSVLLLHDVSAQHAEREYMGSHGMALLSSPNGDLLAHHLPLYSKPHDYQIIYKGGLGEKARTLVAQHDLVTVLPEQFDLSTLIHGQSFTLKAAVYHGHFERGGKARLVVDMEFLEPVFIRRINPLSLSFESATFEHVAIGNDAELVVHHIRSKPSFDVVAWLPNDYEIPSGRLTRCDETATSENDEPNIAQLVRSCFGVEASYFEYRDFQ